MKEFKLLGIIMRKVYHFTVVCLVAWPLTESEAGLDVSRVPVAKS